MEPVKLNRRQFRPCVVALAYAANGELQSLIRMHVAKTEFQPDKDGRISYQ